MWISLHLPTSHGRVQLPPGLDLPDPKWSISFEDSGVTIVVDMETNDFLPGRTRGALGSVPDLRTVWQAQSDPSTTKVRLPSPGPSRAWMDYDVNGGTLTITVDPQTQLLASDPAICAEIATCMEVICHSGTEPGGGSQDCTAAVSVCAAVSLGCCTTACAAKDVTGSNQQLQSSIHD